MAIDVLKSEMLQSYSEVVNHLLKTYIMDEFFSMAYSDINSFQQTTSMNEMEFCAQLWEALRCGCVFYDRHFKSLFADGLVPTTQLMIRNYLVFNPLMKYQAVARHAQALGESHRALNIARV